jgi:glycerol-3-phosphate dehydrogenase
MRRDLGALDREFDVLVIGGGVYGACVARMAARSGWSVALLERDDFGAAVSHNSLKIVHGGFRYVQHFDLVRIRESVAAQRTWLRAAGHLVRPMRCVIPTYGYGTRGPGALAAGIVAFHAMAGRRNAALGGPTRLPLSGLLSRRKLLSLYPDLARPDVTGGAFWYDAQIRDANRLTLECIEDACDRGAVAANHVEVERLVDDGREARGAVAIDRLTGREVEVRARVIVNAAGHRFARLVPDGVGEVDGRRRIVWTRNVNVVVRKLFDTHDALGVASERASDAAVGKSKRLFFVTPWQDRSIIGTSHLQHEGDLDDISQAVEADVAVFLDEVNGALPRAKLTREDVLYVHSGLTPAEDDVTRSKRGMVMNHGATGGLRGLISVLGIKFTTAPTVAQTVLREIAMTIGPARAAATFSTTLPGSPAEGMSAAPACASGQSADAAWAAEVYGTRAAALFAALPKGNLSSAEHVFRCRVLFGVEHEMVVRLRDAIFRATDLAERGHLTRERLDWCAGALGERLGWTPERRAAELRDVEARLAGAKVMVR